MALTYDPDTREAVVCSAWGPNTEWIRNLRAHPALQIQIGRESYVPEQRFLSEDESVAVAVEFRRRHPWRLRLFAAILGWGDLELRHGGEGVRSEPPFVSFRPARPRGLSGGRDSNHDLRRDRPAVAPEHGGQGETVPLGSHIALFAAGGGNDSVRCAPREGPLCGPWWPPLPREGRSRYRGVDFPSSAGRVQSAPPAERRARPGRDGRVSAAAPRVV